MDEDEDDCEIMPSYRWSAWGFAFNVLELATNMCSAFGQFFERLTVDAMAASNKKVDTVEFHEETTRWIESLPETEDHVLPDTTEGG